MKFSNLQAVIFDMDGLLLDSERQWKRAYQQAGLETGRPISDELFGRMIGLNLVASAQVLRDALGDSFDVAAFRQCCLAIKDGLVEKEGIVVKDGVLEMIDFFKSRGLPCGVATSTGRVLALKSLSATGLLDHFGTVVCGDEVRQSKPAPDIYLEAAARLGAEPARCVAFEDSINGLRAAHAAGVPVFMIPDLLEACAVSRSMALEVFASLHEARAWIQGRLQDLP